MTAPHQRWLPHVTVAAVVGRDGRFLCVEEDAAEGRVINQPAGHLEEHESLVAAVAREVLEETAHVFTPAALVGVYHYRSAANGVTYLRFCFTGAVAPAPPGSGRDPAIRAVHWLSREELAAPGRRLRSPLVLAAIDDYLAGRRLALDTVRRLP